MVFPPRRQSAGQPPRPPSGGQLGREHGYEDVKVIGQGSFGVTTLVRNREGEFSVMKTIDIRRLGQSEKEDAVNEAKVLASLKHPYVVRYRESFLEGGNLAIVMEYAEGGDLAQRIARARSSRSQFSEQQIVEWITQATLALKYLHEQHIQHRDMKSHNLFLNKHDKVRLGDFGISKVVESSAVVDETALGTPYYLSPEICTKRLFSFAGDMWALGVILYELAVLRVPFEAHSLPLLLQKISRLNAPALPQNYSPDLRDLCKDLLCRDHRQRPTAADIVQRPLVQDEICRLHQAARPRPASLQKQTVPLPLGEPAALDSLEGPLRGQAVSPSTALAHGGAAAHGATAAQGFAQPHNAAPPHFSPASGAVQQGVALFHGTVKPRPPQLREAESAGVGREAAGLIGMPPRPPSRGDAGRPTTPSGTLCRTGSAALLSAAAGGRGGPGFRQGDAGWIPRVHSGSSLGSRETSCSRGSSTSSCAVASNQSDAQLPPGRSGAGAISRENSTSSCNSFRHTNSRRLRDMSPFLRQARCREAGVAGLPSRPRSGVLVDCQEIH
mmetsp:Transcript_65606/g.211670  ORF Transcript_65606/g.211670 Transcript_65606/m.211670 type:complete len:556 (+) Transcript_65606:62-1729(+)